MATAPAIEASTWLPTEMLVGGRLVAGHGQTFPVTNPSTGEVTVELAGATISQFRQALASARTAADEGSWAATAPGARVEVLRHFLKLLGERGDALKSLMVTETGACP